MGRFISYSVNVWGDFATFSGSREKIEKYKEKKKEERGIYVGNCLPGKHSRPL